MSADKVLISDVAAGSDLAAGIPVLPPKDRPRDARAETYRWVAEHPLYTGPLLPPPPPRPFPQSILDTVDEETKIEAQKQYTPVTRIEVPPDTNSTEFIGAAREEYEKLRAQGETDEASMDTKQAEAAGQAADVGLDALPEERPRKGHTLADALRKASAAGGASEQLAKAIYGDGGLEEFKRLSGVGPLRFNGEAESRIRLAIHAFRTRRNAFETLSALSGDERTEAFHRLENEHAAACMAQLRASAENEELRHKFAAWSKNESDLTGRLKDTEAELARVNALLADRDAKIDKRVAQLKEAVGTLDDELTRASKRADEASNQLTVLTGLLKKAAGDDGDLQASLSRIQAAYAAHKRTGSTADKDMDTFVPHRQPVVLLTASEKDRELVAAQQRAERAEEAMRAMLVDLKKTHSLLSADKSMQRLVCDLGELPDRELQSLAALVPRLLAVLGERWPVIQEATQIPLSELYGSNHTAVAHMVAQLGYMLKVDTNGFSPQSNPWTPVRCTEDEVVRRWMRGLMSTPPGFMTASVSGALGNPSSPGFCFLMPSSGNWADDPEAHDLELARDRIAEAGKVDAGSFHFLPAILSPGSTTNSPLDCDEPSNKRVVVRVPWDAKTAPAVMRGLLRSGVMGDAFSETRSLLPVPRGVSHRDYIAFLKALPMPFLASRHIDYLPEQEALLVKFSPYLHKEADALDKFFSYLSTREFPKALLPAVRISGLFKEFHETDEPLPAAFATRIGQQRHPDKREKLGSLAKTRREIEVETALFRATVHQSREMLASALVTTIPDRGTASKVRAWLKSDVGSSVLSVALGAMEPVIRGKLPERMLSKAEEVGRELRVQGLAKLEGIFLEPLASGLGQLLSRMVGTEPTPAPVPAPQQLPERTTVDTILVDTDHEHSAAK